MLCSSFTPSFCTPFNHFRLLDFPFFILCFLPPPFPLSPSFCLTLRFLHSPLFFSLFPCLCLLLLSVSQSRIPGTVIPLCSAQCERIFNTTRTPGEETGKETDMYTHRQSDVSHSADTQYCLNMSGWLQQKSPHQFLTNSEHC